MAQYFIENASGNIEAGSTISWKFPEFEELFSVTGVQVVAPEYLSFDWSGGEEGMLVEIFLVAQADGSTVVRIKESSMDDDEAGIQQAIGQTEGWANFLACLKANLEYGINLRKGAFLFL